jgi:hypothetical protein
MVVRRRRRSRGQRVTHAFRTQMTRLLSDGWWMMFFSLSSVQNATKTFYDVSCDGVSLRWLRRRC